MHCADLQNTWHFEEALKSESYNVEVFTRKWSFEGVRLLGIGQGRSLNWYEYQQK